MGRFKGNIRGILRSARFLFSYWYVIAVNQKSLNAIAPKPPNIPQKNPTILPLKLPSLSPIPYQLLICPLWLQFESRYWFLKRAKFVSKPNRFVCNRACFLCWLLLRIKIFPVRSKPCWGTALNETRCCRTLNRLVLRSRILQKYFSLFAPPKTKPLVQRQGLVVFWRWLLHNLTLIQKRGWGWVRLQRILLTDKMRIFLPLQAGY